MVQKPVDERKKRGRPRSYDPKQAVAQAADAFWKAGYSGTSLDDLAAATGMNRPSLYAAFGDKRDLYLKTLEHYRDESRAIARKAVADNPPLRTFLQRAYAAALDLYLQGEDKARGCYTIGTAATEAAVDARVRAFLADSMRGGDAFFTGRLQKAKERGEISADADPKALAYLATATLHTLAVRSRAGIPRKELEAIANAAIDLICGRQAR
jgi:TetR/AcrR family transcriptional regulator, copper-responsive repressor